MNMTYISKIQANLKRYRTIHSKRSSGQILDGSYKSVFKGRSMNFDELREYVQGDDVKDIDWKASARSQKVLVRQYIAEKKHNIMLVFDTNRRMLADSDGLEEKRNLAIMSAGTLAYFAEKNGDYIAAAYMSKDGMRHFPFRTGLGNIEMILESYEKDVTEDNRTDVNDSLYYLLRNFKRSMIILIVSDIAGFRSITDETLRLLKVNHDVICLNISDAPVSGKEVYLYDEGQYASPFFAKSKSFARNVREKKLDLIKELTERLKQYGIPCSTIDYVGELDREIIELLDKNKLMSGA